MKFREVLISKARGRILGHSISFKEKKIKKGKILRQDDIKILKENSIKKVFVAIFKKDDILENDAADKIAKHITSKNIINVKAINGRADFFSKIDGMVDFQLDNLIDINYKNSAVALSSVKQYSLVKKGQLIGNIKILPYAIKKSELDKILNKKKFKDFFSIKPVVRKEIILILSLENLKEDNKKIISAIQSRLEELKLKLTLILTVAHEVLSLSNLLKKNINHKNKIVLIYGSTSISDINDIIPSAIENLGGKIITFGAPTDPGNLILLASKNKTIIIGVPGCAKSISRNGFDLVLQRSCHGIIFTKKMIAEMSNGGLFKKTIRNFKV